MRLLFRFPNEIIIIIYTYADVQTKYKLLTIYKWLLRVKLPLKCDNANGNCNNDAIYILRYKIQLTHDTTRDIHGTTCGTRDIIDIGIKGNSNCYSKYYSNCLYLTKLTCSLKCKKSLVLEYNTVSDTNYTNDLGKGDFYKNYIRKNNLCKNNLCIKNIYDTTESHYLSSYLTRHFSFYYGNGYGNEWYNTDYRIQYNNKNYNDSLLNLEYYVYHQDKCFLCNKSMFDDLIVVKGFVL